MVLKQQFKYLAPSMVPRDSSYHGCPLWVFQYANKYSEGISSPWEAVSMTLCMDG